MYGTGSGIVAMPYSHVKTALENVQCIYEKRSSSGTVPRRSCAMPWKQGSISSS
jgi:hypothetical protein